MGLSVLYYLPSTKGEAVCSALEDGLQGSCGLLYGARAVLPENFRR